MYLSNQCHLSKIMIFVLLMTNYQKDNFDLYKHFLLLYYTKYFFFSKFIQDFFSNHACELNVKLK